MLVAPGVVRAAFSYQVHNFHAGNFDYGEIAEQISKFRGEIGSNGKPDLLRKHPDRFEVVLTSPHRVIRAKC